MGLKGTAALSGLLATTLIMNTGVASDEHRDKAHRGEPVEGKRKAVVVVVVACIIVRKGPLETGKGGKALEWGNDGRKERTAQECMNSQLRDTPARACIYEGVWV